MAVRRLLVDNYELGNGKVLGAASAIVAAAARTGFSLQKACGLTRPASGQRRTSRRLLAQASRRAPTGRRSRPAFADWEPLGKNPAAPRAPSVARVHDKGLEITALDPGAWLTGVDMIDTMGV